jgi:hypothetical protein
MISNFHTVKARRFGTSERTSDGVKLITPGPGTYRPPSDFGYIEFKPRTGTTPINRMRPSNGIITRSGRQVSVDFLAGNRNVSKIYLF